MLKCAYCGLKRPQEELKKGRITFIRHNFWLGKRQAETKESWYCADKDCYECDQMAHEG